MQFPGSKQTFGTFFFHPWSTVNDSTGLAGLSLCACRCGVCWIAQFNILFCVPPLYLPRGERGPPGCLLDVRKAQAIANSSVKAKTMCSKNGF